MSWGQVWQALGNWLQVISTLVLDCTAEDINLSDMPIKPVCTIKSWDGRDFLKSKKPLMLWIIPPFIAHVGFTFGWAKAWEFTRESREFQRKANLCPGSALLLLQSASMCHLHKVKYCTQEKRSLELKFSTCFVAEERNFCSCTFPMEMYRVIFHYCCCSLSWHFLVLPLPVCVNYLHREVFKV